jgi:hypothetical protein
MVAAADPILLPLLAALGVLEEVLESLSLIV